VHVHSQASPTTVRTQEPWSLPTLCVSELSKTSFANVRMLPAESPAVPFVTASVVACSITWIEPPAFARELPAVALTTAKTRTAAAAAAAGTSRRFISPPLSRRTRHIAPGRRRLPAGPPEVEGRLGPAPGRVRQRHTLIPSDRATSS